MKHTVPIIAFLIIAVALIGGGIWYSNTLSSQNFKIEDVKVGTGVVARNGDTVTVNYVGTLDDGTKFDASADHGQPFSFPLGAEQVIKGWDMGVLGMKVGGTRKLTIPPEIAYGNRSVGPIPPNSTLHFTVDLLAVATSTSK